MTDFAQNELGVERDAEIILHKQAHPLPGQFRAVRRLALLSMVLDACRQSQASLPQLHVLNWAVRTKASRHLFLKVLTGAIAPDEALVRFDPSLPRLVQYGVGEGIITDRPDVLIDGATTESSKSYRITLTTKGKELANLVRDSDLLSDERLFLESVKNKVTQRFVHDLIGGKQ
jgi:hypothetical protein